MGKYINLMDKMRAKGGGREKMDEVIAILDDMFCELEKCNPTLYAEVISKFEAMVYEIDKPEAEKIVKAMKPYGQKWSYEQVKDYVTEKGITENFCKWYLCMNMACNDYYKTAELIGKADDVEFYYSISKDFIMDVDGKPFKVEKYFMGM